MGNICLPLLSKFKELIPLIKKSENQKHEDEVIV